MADGFRLGAYVLDCPRPAELAEFYAQLLDWTEQEVEDDWVTLRDPAGGTSLAFQLDPDFVPTTWPQRDRPMMAHLDFVVADMPAEHERALALGARLLDGTHETFWVYADPQGQIFCLCAA